MKKLTKKKRRKKWNKEKLENSFYSSIALVLNHFASAKYYKSQRASNDLYRLLLTTFTSRL